MREEDRIIIGRLTQKVDQELGRLSSWADGDSSLDYGEIHNIFQYCP